MQPAEPAEAACERAGETLLACEIDRGHNDVLDAAGSIPASRLGEGGVRFSSMPALGGNAYVIEFRPDRRGGARVRFSWFYGHQGWRWIGEGRRTFDISPAAFREIAATVAAAMTRLDPLPPGVYWVCADGPGFLTERVHEGRVFSMTGSCGFHEHEPHPHREIEATMLDLICPRFGEEFDPGTRRLGENCVRRARRLRSARR